MFDLNSELVLKIDSKVELLEQSVTSEDKEVVYASLGCTTCEAFAQ